MVATYFESHLVLEGNAHRGFAANYRMRFPSDTGRLAYVRIEPRLAPPGSGLGCEQRAVAGADD